MSDHLLHKKVNLGGGLRKVGLEKPEGVDGVKSVKAVFDARFGKGGKHPLVTGAKSRLA